MFSNAQEFYEHLDDCVLRVVQQEEPSELINEQRLAEVANDQAVQETLDRNMIPSGIDHTKQNNEDEEDDMDDLRDEGSDESWAIAAGTNPRSGKGTIKPTKGNSSWQSTHPQGVSLHVGGGNNISKSGRVSGGKGRGMTFSKGGVPLVGKGRKKRKHYPLSWGCSADKMKMKKRVLCIYDGPRRLWKDDMMLDSEFEVRMQLGDGKSYVTDLDMQTVKRANAMHNATEDEKGPWLEDEVDIEKLMSSRPWALEGYSCI